MVRTKQGSLKRRPLFHPKRKLLAARKSAPATAYVGLRYEKPAISRYTVRLSYQQGKTLDRGLVLFNAKCDDNDDELNDIDEISYDGSDSDEPTPKRLFRLSSSSPIFMFAKHLLDHAASTAGDDSAEFKSGDDSRDLDALINWGRKNLSHLQNESSRVKLKELSDEHLRMALTGVMMPYDVVERIEFTNPSPKNVATPRGTNHFTAHETKGESGDIEKILKSPESYPLYITFKRERDPYGEHNPHNHDLLKIQDSECGDIVMTDEDDTVRTLSDSSPFVDYLPSVMARLAEKDPTDLRFKEGDFVHTQFGPGRVLSSRIERHPNAVSDRNDHRSGRKDGQESGRKRRLDDKDESRLHHDDATIFKPILMYCVDLNFGTCHMPEAEIRWVNKEETPYSDFNEYAAHSKRCCWKRDMIAILENVDQKGDFCWGEDVSDAIPFLSPSIRVDGMEDQLAFPLTKSQAKELQSASQNKFIHATELQFQEDEKWEAVVQGIAIDCASALGVGHKQQKYLKARFRKLILSPPGRRMELSHLNEDGMFGTLIMQLPSCHTGGEVDVAFGGEKKTIDFSGSRSDQGVFAAAFYSDCHCQFSPVSQGWKLCLEYDLLISPSYVISSSLTLPSASELGARTQRLQLLASSWGDNFNHFLGYLLEHDYKGDSLEGDNLKFSNLKQRDKEVVDVLRECRGKDGKKLFSVCLLLMQYGKGDRIELDDDMGRLRFNFDKKQHLLVRKRKGWSIQENVFGKHKPLVNVWWEEDRHTGCRSTRHEDKRRSRSAVVFWPNAITLESLQIKIRSANRK